MERCSRKDDLQHFAWERAFGRSTLPPIASGKMAMLSRRLHQSLGFPLRRWTNRALSPVIGRMLFDSRFFA